MKSWSLIFATQMVFRRYGSELFDTFKNIILLRIFQYKIFIHEKWLENYNDKFQENLSQPGIIVARARYQAAAQRLRKTGLCYEMEKLCRHTVLHTLHRKLLCAQLQGDNYGIRLVKFTQIVFCCNRKMLLG